MRTPVFRSLMGVRGFAVGSEVILRYALARTFSSVISSVDVDRCIFSFGKDGVFSYWCLLKRVKGKVKILIEMRDGEVGLLVLSRAVYNYFPPFPKSSHLLDR